MLTGPTTDFLSVIAQKPVKISQINLADAYAGTNTATSRENTQMKKSV